MRCVPKQDMPRASNNDSPLDSIVMSPSGKGRWTELSQRPKISKGQYVGVWVTTENGNLEPAR